MSSECSNEEARRSYWTRIMDEAHDFMQKMIDYPVEECREPMESLIDAVKNAGVEVTFSSRPHAQGQQRMHFLRAGLIDDFIRISREMNSRGWKLHIEDAFRSRSMQGGLARQDYVLDVILKRVLWELNGKPLDPDLLFRRIGSLIALLPKVGTHMSGSAVDVSVVRCSDGIELDRCGAYLEMSELTPMDSPFVSDGARQNRKQITEVFQKFGFVAYPYEFWHYSKGDVFDGYLQGTSKPARYGAIDFDPLTGRISPVEKPAKPLNSLDNVRQMADKVLKHLGHSD